MLGTRGGCSTCTQAQGPILALPLPCTLCKMRIKSNFPTTAWSLATAVLQGHASIHLPPLTPGCKFWGQVPWIWLHSLSLGLLLQTTAGGSRNNHQAQLATRSSLLAIPTSPALSPQIPSPPWDDPGGAASIFSRVGARHWTWLGEIIGSGRAGGGEGKCLCAGEQRRPSRHASSARCGAGLRGMLGRETRGRSGVSQLPAQ